MAVGFGFSGFYFVNYVFDTSLEREIKQTLDESSILKFAFETAALNIPAKYDVLQDDTIEQIAWNLESGGRDTRRLLRLSDERKSLLYMSDGFKADYNMLLETDQSRKTYRIIEEQGKYYIQTGMSIHALDRVLYLETMKDVSEVFKERALGFSVYRRVTIFMLFFGTVIMHFMSSWLTKPIRLLTRATKRMATGDYDYRAKQISGDELGQLTMDFNKMASALEENINKLEEEIRAREDFVGAFAHELKTPLTAIIGYADMMRSRRLDEKQNFLSANYIYTEGKRLESMSFRLLDIIVTKRGEAELKIVSVSPLFEYLQNMFVTNKTMKFRFDYEEERVQADANLIKTVLINLLDNACKASEPGSFIDVMGYGVEEGYCFAVRDYGIGIPKEEQKKIMKAFYMVDKSRARSKNGAGLGLALCAEILLLHESSLKIQSEPLKGTCMSFILAYGREEEF
jgi:signal transduction histidine kinase